jgi:hypothetical protein
MPTPSAGRAIILGPRAAIHRLDQTGSPAARSANMKMSSLEVLLVEPATSQKAGASPSLNVARPG